MERMELEQWLNNESFQIVNRVLYFVLFITRHCQYLKLTYMVMVDGNKIRGDLGRTGNE